MVYTGMGAVWENLTHSIPMCNPTQPGPVLTERGQEEWLIEQILDKHNHGRGKQYLVQWQGWDAEKDQWLPGHKLEDTEALDDWLSA